MRRNFDVAVIGGGPAGSATALDLAHKGFSVVVVERTDYQSARFGEVLPPEIQQPLAELGLWDRFLADNHSLSPGVLSSWGSPELHEKSSIMNPFGGGWHVDRQRFDAMLADATEEAGARFHRSTRLVSCVPLDGSGWFLEITSGSERLQYCSSFLVDATGKASWVGIRQGGKRIFYDQLIGVIGYLSPRSQEALALDLMLLEATENGWWYSALLPYGNMILAYMTDADLYGKGIRSSGKYWHEQLQDAPHTRARISSFSPKPGLKVVSSRTSRLDPISGGNWLAVGDAAAAFDPLSSQGVYNALNSGLRGAHSIQTYWAGDQAALRDYDAWVNSNFHQYLLLRLDYYSKERRWPNSQFWQRRQP